jgi:hypothetical protein
MSKALYEKMFFEARRAITPWVEQFGRPLTLVSGGAAWADHIAVSLFLDRFMHCSLELHLPCPFDLTVPAYQDDGSRDFRKNPGGTSNYYHRQFSQKMGGNTLTGLRKAIRSANCEIIIGKGFHDRNSGIAKVDCMLCFHFAGRGATKPKGGSLDTWNKSKAYEKVYVPLESL